MNVAFFLCEKNLLDIFGDIKYNFPISYKSVTKSIRKEKQK